MTSNPMNAQDGQTYETSTGNIDGYLGFVEAGGYLSPVRFSSLFIKVVLIISIFQAFNSPSMPLPSHPEYLYGNHCTIPVPPLAAVSCSTPVSKISTTNGAKHKQNTKASTHSS